MGLEEQFPPASFAPDIRVKTAKDLVPLDDRPHGSKVANAATFLVAVWQAPLGLLRRVP